MSTSAQTGYFALLFGTNATLFKYVAGVLTQLGSNVAHGLGTLNTAVSFTISVSVSGTTISGRLQRASDGQYLTPGGTYSATPSDYVSVTDAAISAAGRVGFWQCTSSAANTTPVVASFTAIDSASNQFTVTPSTVPDEDASIVLTLTGTATTWAVGGAEFAVSGLAGVSKLAENVTSATAATLTIETVGGVTGTLTITDGDGLTQTVTVATASLARTPTSINASATTTVNRRHPPDSSPCPAWPGARSAEHRRSPTTRTRRSTSSPASRPGR
jgi:hypothetical protein